VPTPSLCRRSAQLATKPHNEFTVIISAQHSPRDLPVSGQAVQLRLRVRRFRRLNTQCSKQTFGEPLPALIAPIARRTNRLTALLGVYAIESGGEPGARLLKAGGTKVSPDTLLRLAKAGAAQRLVIPEILGVDDFGATRSRTCSRKDSRKEDRTWGSAPECPTRLNQVRLGQCSHVR
jgi:hypothetical protein